MPKMKTHRGAAKRVKKTASGKLKRDHAFTCHNFSNKNRKRKRNLSKSGYVSSGDMKRVRTLVPYL